MNNNIRKVFYLNLFFASFILMGLSSCNDENVVPESEIAELDLLGAGIDKLDFSADGGVTKLKLKSNEYWTVECASPWCMVSPLNGKGGETVCEIHVDSTAVYEMRNTKIYFRSGAITKEINISQDTYGEVLEFSDSLMNALPEYASLDNSYFTLSVKANVDFTVDSEHQWITPQKFTYKESVIPRTYKIKFLYDPSFSSTERSTNVILKSTNGNKTVSYKVKQRSSAEIEDNRRGDSLALIAVTRGLRAYTSWDHSKDMLHWSGVTLDEMQIRDANGHILKNRTGKDSTEMRVTGLSIVLFNTKASIPKEIKYLTYLRSLSLTGNENSQLKRIKLGSEIATLDSLRVLNLTGCAISEIDPSVGNLKSLEILSMNGNALRKIPRDVIESLYNKRLRYLNISGNRLVDGFNDLSKYAHVIDTIGLSPVLHEDLIWLFRLEDMRAIELSYNYIRGHIPTQKEIYPDDPTKKVLPKCRSLHLNLNSLEGEIPTWVIGDPVGTNAHPHLCAWDPFTMVFNQEVKTLEGKKSGFTNEPSTSDLNCEDYDWGQPEDPFSWEVQSALGVSFDQYVKGFLKF